MGKKTRLQRASLEYRDDVLGRLMKCSLVVPDLRELREKVKAVVRLSSSRLNAK